jgi:protein tyrosine/serine phosphatase
VSGRRAARLSAGLAVALALVGFGAYEYWALALDHFATIRAGEAYRSGAMPPEKLLATVRAHGIRAVVDLRRDRADVEAERALLAQAGVRHFNVPSAQVPDAQTVDAFLAVVSDPANRPVLIHCEHGVGRAPLFEAIYRIELLGWDPESARSSARWRSGLGAFEPEDPKGHFLLTYEPRRRAAVAGPPPR